MKRIAACALMLVLVLSACSAESWNDWDPENWFPLWEEPGEPPASRESVYMWFFQVERPSRMKEWLEWIDEDFRQIDWTMLHVKSMLKEETVMPLEDGWWIDYYYHGAWHTVYRGQALNRSSAERLVVHGRLPGLFDDYIPVPAKALEPAGRYRLCYQNHGTFPFYILGVHNEIII